MRKKWVLMLIFVILFSLGGLLLGVKFKSKSQGFPERAQISLLGTAFEAEVVSSEKTRAQGLSDREDLCSRCVMLFVFPDRSVRNFWMKDMRFDLDLLWISGSEIVKISKNVSHLRGTKEIVNSEFPVDKVIEMNAGSSDQLQLRVGESIDF